VVHGVAYVLQMLPNVVQKLHMGFFSSTTTHPFFVFAHGVTNVACGVFFMLLTYIFKVHLKQFYTCIFSSTICLHNASCEK
jgi:hypothetical protein